jgi:hypothetical protein
MRKKKGREKLMVIAYHEQGQVNDQQLLINLKTSFVTKERLMKLAHYTQKLVPGARPKYPVIKMYPQ